MMEHETMVVDDHRIQLGGSEGDGYCYSHQSFDCFENLTDADRERAVIKSAVEE